MLTVVNINKERCDIYIGRSKQSRLHYGNPFAIGTHGTREQCLHMFELWIRGVDYKDIEPERRAWILGTLHILQGRLGCYCAPHKCHGDILIDLIQECQEPDSSMAFKESTIWQS